MGNDIDLRYWSFLVLGLLSLMLLAGTLQGRYGVGSPGSVADPVRNEHKSSSFAHLKFKNLVDDAEEWSVSASWTQDNGRDAYPVPLLSGGTLDLVNDRQANRYSLEYQHYKTLSPQLRAFYFLKVN